MKFYVTGITPVCDMGYRRNHLGGLHLTGDIVLSEKEGNPMFVRVLRMKLKPHGDKGITPAADREILPILKKFTGFVGEFTLVSRDKKEAVGSLYGSAWKMSKPMTAKDRPTY